jgi:hypothetical protein
VSSAGTQLRLPHAKQALVERGESFTGETLAAQRGDVSLTTDSVTFLRKMWHSRGHGLDLGRFLARIKAGSDYDIADLRNLLRRDQNPDLPAMIARVVENLQFLGQMTDSERVLSADSSQRQRAVAATLLAQLSAT